MHFDSQLVDFQGIAKDHCVLTVFIENGRRKINYIKIYQFKAEAHRHKENRVADRKRTNQNILPIRKNLMFYSLSESANKSVDFAPF